MKRISADTPDCNLKFFYELSQKFKRFVVVVVSLNSAVQNTKPRACQHHLRIVAYRFVLPLYIDAYKTRHAPICARFGFLFARRGIENNNKTRC